ncbi:hypothetical protein [Tolypothrix sp. VBCCA 56010]|uniref:hypothetical protein n=1 Tax=Tolypothrix sp. VBCCA 56010 TaxID=3137731 RepID=UPI003D7E40AE
MGALLVAGWSVGALLVVGCFHVQCPMPNAQCPMPNAQCPMPNAQCPMPNAQCPMPNYLLFFNDRKQNIQVS